MKLSIGDQAPEIHGKDQNGKDFSLAQFSGKKIALYFYPKDDTPGCTAQACSLRDNEIAMQTAGFQTIGVSVDSEIMHQKFISKYNLPFPLIADIDHKVVTDYGVWVEKSMYGKKYMGTARTTFVIDEKGIIVNIIENVDTKDHAKQILG